ncbi:MAG: epoxyqueuosine reductase QueH [Oscillospiraceae bacterium]|nr:epoxyqueuosine reductase QueH [Oscillospiraceae bacterium]
MENIYKQNRINYQLKLDEIIRGLDPDAPPSLLMHCCCGPCSSYCLEYLAQYFSISVLFYNPNIFPEDEYLLRKSELMKLLCKTGYRNPVTVIDCDYLPETYEARCSSLADEPEGGKRCTECFIQRLEFTARAASLMHFDWFCSTLTVSPHKNSQLINQIGYRLSEVHNIPWLPSDFKKRNGYLRSIELSKEYGLYRQDYCGCRYSVRTDR